MTPRTNVGTNDDVFFEGLEAIRGARLLLAEDNEINQQVALELLEGEGFQVTVVANGVEAVQAVRTTHFDALLMDIQMPVMDGFQATQIIRQEQRWQHLPIIAMTANALSGDRERCLAMGMNDHIAKPIQPAQMFATLALWVKPSEPVRQTQPRAAARPKEESASIGFDLEGFNQAEALERMGYNADLYRKLLLDFRQRYADADHQVRAGLATGQLADSSRLVHTLKGIAGTLGATALQTAAASLEQRLRQESGPELETFLAPFTSALTRTLAVLAVLDAKSLEPPSDAATVALTAPALAAALPLLQRLDQQLVRGDATANKVAGELVGLLEGSPFAPSMAAVVRQVDHYDFDEARTTLHQLVQALQESSRKSV